MSNSTANRILKGVIEGFRGTRNSETGYLLISGRPVPCANPATVRALEACFGNVIAPGNTVDNVNGGHVGQEVYYSTDEFGLLEGFTPVEDAPRALVEFHEAQGNEDPSVAHRTH